MKKCRKKRSASTLAFFCALGFSASAVAIEPIPEETGWSGFFLLGAGFTSVKSNTVVGNDIIDVGVKSVRSIFDSPRSDDTVHPLVGLELKYTLPGRSQFFLGSSLEDRLTMDFANQLGWRKQTDSSGTFQIGLLLSEPAVELWADPYLVSVPREEVDRDAFGVRFEWANVLGSNFGILLQTRELELDDELSGTDPALGCDANCQSLLDRNGDQIVARVSYRFVLSPSHILEPEVRFRDEDRDGAAKARDAWSVRLSYAYLRPPWTFVGNVLYGESEYDEPNPLYGLRQDADTYGVDATLLYNLPTQSGRWQLSGSVFVGESDSQIEFHDNELSQIAVGFIYHFGQSRSPGT